MIKLSIIIVNFNTASLLQKCLTSIIADTKEMLNKNEMEIIIVDNGSTDKSISIIKKDFPNTLLIANKENLGFGKANNQGIKKAKGEYILLLNSDIEVLDKGVTKLFNFYQKEKYVDILGGKLFSQGGTPQASCGPFYSLPVVFLMLFLKGDKLGITRFSPTKVKEVDWISGACLLSRKEIFEKVNYFDENIFMYMDEIDFLYRAKKAGFRVFFYPSAHFTHIGSASGVSRSQPILNIYNGLIYFYRKHKNSVDLLFLKIMLKSKAFLALFWGWITNNNYLREAYGKAFKLA